MRYIRTKDGRIGKVTSIRDYNGPYPTYYHVSFQNDKEIYNDYELYIIKEADTIEELCDEFIYNYYGKHLRCYYSPNTNTWVDEDSGCDLHKNFAKTIKGAIWTDKGLIYVAKMNEKGELELL